MKGLWILAGLVVAAAGFGFWLSRDTAADVDRLFETAVKDQPLIEQALGDCGDVVHYFAERKPAEHIKGELGTLRARFEQLVKKAKQAHDEESSARDERKKALASLETDFWQLKTDAFDLRARLGQMKLFDGELKPVIARLGEMTAKLAAAQQQSSDPEFQQRAGALIEEGSKFRKSAERALVRFVGKNGSIAVAQTDGTAQLNELKDVLKRMDQLLASPSH